MLPPIFGLEEARKAQILAEMLFSLDASGEVTANDVGTLHALRVTLGPGVLLGFGRLLVPERNDPRLTRYPAGHGVYDALAVFAQDHLRALADRFLVHRVEISSGIRWPRGPLPFRLSIHEGPALLSVARACPTFNARVPGRDDGRPYRVPLSCSRPCQAGPRMLRDPQGGETFLLDGNGLWAPVGIPADPLPPEADRLVCHPQT